MEISQPPGYVMEIPKYSYQSLNLENHTAGTEITCVKPHAYRYMAVGFSNGNIQLYDFEGYLANGMILCNKSHRNIDPLPIKDIDVNESGSHIVACTANMVMVYDLQEEVSPMEDGTMILNPYITAAITGCNRAVFTPENQILVGSVNLTHIWKTSGSGLFSTSKLERRILDENTSSRAGSTSSSSVHAILFDEFNRHLAYATTRAIKVGIWVDGGIKHIGSSPRPGTVRPASTSLNVKCSMLWQKQYLVCAWGDYIIIGHITMVRHRPNTANATNRASIAANSSSTFSLSRSPGQPRFSTIQAFQLDRGIFKGIVLQPHTPASKHKLSVIALNQEGAEADVYRYGLGKETENKLVSATSYVIRYYDFEANKLRSARLDNYCTGQDQKSVLRLTKEATMTPGSEDKVIIFTNTTLMSGAPLTPTDQVQYLIDNEKLEDAFNLACNHKDITEIKQEAAKRYLNYLIRGDIDGSLKTGTVEVFPRVIAHLPSKPYAWPDIINRYRDVKLTHRLVPYIPLSVEKMDREIFTEVAKATIKEKGLEHFLGAIDREVWLILLNVQEIIEFLKHSTEYMSHAYLADLYLNTGQPKQAYFVLLQNKSEQVFDLIQKYNITGAYLLNNLDRIISIDEARTVDYLLRHVDLISPSLVCQHTIGIAHSSVDKFLTSYLTQITHHNSLPENVLIKKIEVVTRNRPDMLFGILRDLKPMLLDNSEFLAKAGSIVRKYSSAGSSQKGEERKPFLINESVWLLGLEGKREEALKLLLVEKHDYRAAITFSKEWNVWETLLELAKDYAIEQELLPELIDLTGFNRHTLALLKSLPNEFQLSTKNLGQTVEQCHWQTDMWKLMRDVHNRESFQTITQIIQQQSQAIPKPSE